MVVADSAATQASRGSGLLKHDAAGLHDAAGGADAWTAGVCPPALTSLHGCWVLHRYVALNVAYNDLLARL